MSRRISRLSVVALVALTAVIVCLVFVVLRMILEPGFEDEIPVVDKDEIPVFAAEVSTISLPIKADYAALASRIRDDVAPELPMNMEGGTQSITLVRTYDFFYTPQLLSLDVSLRELADRPVLFVIGKLRLFGPVKSKMKLGRGLLNVSYDGEFEFKRAYTLALDEDAEMTVEPLGELQVRDTRRAEIKILGVRWKEQTGWLKKMVMPEVNNKVKDKLKEHLDKDHLTPWYKKGWENLHNPISLTGGVWLVLHPEGFEVAQLRSSGTMLETAVTVLARPEVVLGDKPQVPKAPPMPPVRLGEAGGGLHVVADAIMPLDEAERLLNKELGGLEKVMYKQAKVKVSKARIYSRENWLRLELVLTKPFRGSVFLEGAPMYDAENNEFYVEGLDFTAETKNLLAKSASLLLENRVFRDYFQTKVRLPVGGPLAKVGESISGYEKEVADGVVFQVGDMTFKMLGVYNTREAIHFIVQADGSAEVTMEPPVPSPPTELKVTTDT